MEISYERGEWRKKVSNEAKLRGYSDKTISNYLYNIGRFLKSGIEFKDYLLRLIDSKKSANTIRSVGFAIKFYYKVMGEDEGKDLIIPNFKKENKLPVVLSKIEIGKMIKSTNNLNHRLIIQIGYAAGLRASEIINLKWEDIDFFRNVIHIKSGKGKKDRVLMLSPKIKKGLKALTDERMGFIFLTNRAKKYSLRSIELIVETAKKKVGINKKVTPHTLRHSFATHLIEDGIDILHVQKLLGHSDVSTTMIYTKVSNKDLIKIKSPIDL